MFSYTQILEDCRNKPITSEYHTIADYYDEIVSIYGNAAESRILSEATKLEKRNGTKSSKLLRAETETMVSFLCESCPYEPECSGPNSLTLCKNEIKEKLINSISSIAEWMKKEQISIPDKQITSFAWYIFQAVFSGKQTNAIHNTFDLKATALELFLKEQHTWLVSKYGWEGEGLKEEPEDKYIDIPAFILDVLWHFKKAGFSVTSQTVEKFIELSELINLYDISEIYSLAKMLICKTTEEEDKFNITFYSKYGEYIPTINKTEAEDMTTSRENKVRLQSELKTISQEEKNISKIIDNTNSKINLITEDIRKALPNEEDLALIRSLYNKYQKQIDDIIEEIQDDEHKDFLISILNGEFQSEYYLLNDFTEVREIIEESMLAALFQPDAVEVIDFFSQVKNLLNNIEPKLRRIKEKYIEEHEKYLDATTRQQNVKRRIAQISKALDKEDIVIKKTESIFHRKEFIGGYRSVQSDSKGEIGDMEFSEMQESDKKILYRSIRINAEKIRKIMNKNIKSKEKRTLDLSETVKHACGTGGIPIRLFYKEPRKASPNIVMILDISGSCRNASETMLVFMHHMLTVFQGGCKAFVFVRDMHDVTNAIKGDNPEDAVRNVLSMIPTRGVYSSYEVALEDMKNKYMSCINKDSYVFFIGDARNNSNDTKENIIKEIAAKANKCYWLNTEKREEWNIGDSVIDVYAKYMDEVAEIVKTSQFMRFIMWFPRRFTLL